MNGVADVTGQEASRLATCAFPPDSLAFAIVAGLRPLDDDESPSQSGYVSAETAALVHQSSEASANSVDISDASPEAAAWQKSVAALGIVIIDDCALFREILVAILAARGLVVESEAWDLPSLVAAFEGSSPSVMVLNMATRGGRLLIRAANDMSPGVRIIVLGLPEDDEEAIIACAEAGVAGYHMRGDSLDELIMLIHNVARGEAICPPRVSAVLLRRLSNLASQPQLSGRDLVLTTRETQILKMLELGRSNRDIAKRLDIAVHTVKNHVHNLLTKLGVNTRAEAAAVSRAMWSDRGARKI
ncbi:response regulator transcription factor [Mycobacterium sp. ACS1612]|uniref:LuxR C-terminal-related transcriptional regulator n=1 Tax=Mycobacterium sp. ACS1612 TaxID=1834117 RepID=UPI001E2DB80E|nr:response regulator transcription factor [Mycobacterium sp. ACS1612]